MHYLKITIGLSAVALAWLVLFRTGVIFRVNAWMRDTVFSDRLVLFSGRRVALLLIVLGGLSLFSGVEQVIEVRSLKPEVAASILEEARKDFRGGHYTRVVTRCKELIRSDPKNAEVWELLATAWWALGQKEEARTAVEALLQINPEHPLSHGSLAEYMEKRKGVK